MISFRTSLSIALLASGLTAGACKNPADGKPKAEVAAPVDIKSSAKKADERIVLSPANTKVAFIGSKVTGSQEGDFKKLTGTVELSDNKPEASKINVVIDTTSIATKSEKLTAHLKGEDFFDVTKFPQATFTSTKIEKKTDEKAVYNVTGNLDLHGQQHSISFPATIDVSPSKLSVAAHFSINRKDFGIVYQGMADDMIRDEVVLDISLNVPRK